MSEDGDDASARVRAAMAGLRPVEDSQPFRVIDGGRPARGEPPEPANDREDPAGEDLTPAQWQTLEQCAGYDENDVDNGRRLLKWSSDRILHVGESGWYAWTATHWDPETGDHAVQRLAHQIVGWIKRESALLGPNEQELAVINEAEALKEEFPRVARRPDDVKERIKQGEQIAKIVAQRKHSRYQWGVRSGDRARTKAMIDQAEPHRSVLPKQLDADDFALNTPSGTLRFTREIDTDCPDPDATRYRVRWRLDAHRREDYITKCTAAPFDPKAKAHLWLADFKRFMPDEAKREFLQVFMGYVALGVTGEQVYAFLYGDGSNWKSAFLQSIARVLGSYAKPMAFSAVSGQNTPSSDKPSPEWARLTGVRMLTIEEVPKREPLREELIKMVTSGSDMPVRHLNKDTFDLPVKFAALMTSNAEPNILSGDHGIWRRTLIVNWEVKIADEERKPFDQVMEMYEPERAGVLNWIIEGVEKYLASGLKDYITPEMRAFADSVRRDRDAVGSFIEDCVLDDEGQWVTSRELYRAFQRWCAANGVDPVPSETSFGLKVKRVPVGAVPMEKRKRSVEGIKRYVNVRLHNLPATDIDPHAGVSDD